MYLFRTLLGIEGSKSHLRKTESDSQYKEMNH